MIEWDAEWTEDDMRSLLARSFEDNSWDEAGMDAYDRYDEELSKRCPQIAAKYS